MEYVCTNQSLLHIVALILEFYPKCDIEKGDNREVHGAISLKEILKKMSQVTDVLFGVA